MKGTFKPGDKLILEEIPPGLVQKGDLVVFRAADQGPGDFIVHRVVAIVADGLVTRGDNCRHPDPYPVGGEDLIGRVREFDRRGAARKPWNGARGLLRARALRAGFAAARAFKALLRRPYRTLRKSGLAVKLWRPAIEAIRFETPDGPLIKYVHQGRTVASCWADSARWSYSRPYDLVIGPESQKKKLSPGKA